MRWMRAAATAMLIVWSVVVTVDTWMYTPGADLAARANAASAVCVSVADDWLAFTMAQFVAAPVILSEATCASES